jgi:hypothetical protein
MKSHGLVRGGGCEWLQVLLELIMAEGLEVVSLL